MANPNWKKGVSGNPSGRRPKSEEQREFEKKCKEYSLDALKIIKRKLESQKFEEIKWAVEQVLDRGFGKPLISQEIDLESNDRPPTIEEVHARAVRFKESLPGIVAAIQQGNSGANGVDSGK